MCRVFVFVVVLFLLSGCAQKVRCPYQIPPERLIRASPEVEPVE